MKHRLTVKIEKRFKRQLSKRFNPRNAKSSYSGSNWKETNIDCPLCDEYFEVGIVRCTECPFDIYREDSFDAWGCIKWLSRVVNRRFDGIFVTDQNSICWFGGDNKKAIELLKKLREKAEKYIIWI